MRMRIQTPTLFIITFPMCMNSPELKESSERVSANQVPQKTPETSISKNNAMR